MNKSEIFKEAHKLAKTFVGNYRACFSLALRLIRTKKLFKLSDVGIYNVKEWQKNGYFRVYFKIQAPKIIKKKTILSETSFYFDVIDNKIYKTEDISLVAVIGKDSFNQVLSYFLNEYSNVLLVA